ncbi:MAG TPA: DEAD/DEAH box helicase [Rhizomicrobium sp.]
MTIDTIAGAQAGSEDSVTVASPTNLASDRNSSAQGFDGLGLSPSVLKAVAESGYTTPTPIQARGIPLVLKHRDVIGIAQTGTGKTASFTLPMIEILARGRAKARMPRSLILEPTRELAAQVAESFERYGKYNKLSMALLIGGVSYDDQDRKLDRGVDVLIATPGRLLDHFERGKLMLGQVQVLVVDEADRMLDMGFIPDVERICKLIPFTRQTLFYSATMPPEIKRLTDQFLHNPEQVEVARPATTAETIIQEIVQVPANDWAKREALRRLVRENPVKNAIVFCNRKRDVDVVARSLQKHGFSVAPLHGDLDQAVRTKTLDAFRNGETHLLVASDVAARGLDIPAVSHIFNFDVPFHADDYVHRVGRTGRAGREGHAFMLATPRDAKLVEAIEALTGNPIVSRKMENLEIREDHKHSRAPGRSDRRGSSRERKPAERSHHTPAHQPVAKPEPVRHDGIAAAPKPHSPPPRRDSQPRRTLETEAPDLNQLPAFLLRPVKLPPTEKPAAGKAKKALAPV